jgi:hypothetical protein
VWDYVLGKEFANLGVYEPYGGILHVSPRLSSLTFFQEYFTRFRGDGSDPFEGCYF